MTARSTRGVGLRGLLGLALAFGASALGCVSGHVVEAARRHEQVVEFQKACRDDSHLYLRYRARQSTEFGDELRRQDREATIALKELQNSAGRPVDEIVVEPRVAAGAWERCQSVPLTRVKASDSEVLPPGAEEAWFVALEPEKHPLRLPKGAFARRSTAAWAWVVMPAALVADAVVSPPLVILAFPIFAFGD